MPSNNQAEADQMREKVKAAVNDYKDHVKDLEKELAAERQKVQAIERDIEQKKASAGYEKGHLIARKIREGQHSMEKDVQDSLINSSKVILERQNQVKKMTQNVNKMREQLSFEEKELVNTLVDLEVATYLRKT
ncbi:hypothetical protein HD806DRAFT_259034 [Xylariaceae sp. AK1471]|nr:hypothetical protein HD806DRAFT_259034 [Xylariaceae sp. AK1471]